MSLPIPIEKKKNEINFRDCRKIDTHLRCSPHLHRDLELVCMTSGTSTAFADSLHGDLEPGDVFLSFPNQIHYYEEPEKLRYCLFIVKPDIMPELADVFSMTLPQSPVVRGLMNEPHFVNLINGFSDMWENKENPYRNQIMRGYLLAIFSEVISRMNITRPALGESGTLRSLVSFCTRNYAENLSLSLLEERLHLNKYYISHMFSEKLGLRFNDYINSLRVSEACRYLLNSDYSITRISELVGFNTLRTFNRAFIKQLKISPSEYRKQGLQQFPGMGLEESAHTF